MPRRPRPRAATRRSPGWRPTRTTCCSTRTPAARARSGRPGIGWAIDWTAAASAARRPAVTSGPSASPTGAIAERRAAAAGASSGGRSRRCRARPPRPGLAYLLVENLAAAREPSTMAMIRDLLTDRRVARVPVRLCLDVGHMCVPGTTGDDRDPYAWLRALGRVAPVIQLQQSDAEGDHHWPFTPERNAAGSDRRRPGPRRPCRRRRRGRRR